VTFYTNPSNLVAGDANGRSDIFVRDRVSGVTQRISVAADGSEARGNSIWPSISSDGRYIVYQSDAANLLPNSNATQQAYFYDLQTGMTEMVSVSSTGAAGTRSSADPDVSDDGSFFVFQSLAPNLVPDDTNVEQDIFVRSRTSGTTTRISVGWNGAQGNGQSRYPRMSRDGGYIVYASRASNLVTGDTNRATDIFVYSRTSGQTQRVSIAGDGTQANGHSDYPMISGDGRWIAFESDASNLVPDDTNGVTDVFMTANPLYDADGDGTPDGKDGCPADSSKTAPGVCGCGEAETDRDRDGTPDCADLCPDDFNKTAPGAAGCNADDTIVPDTVLQEYPRVPKGVTSPNVPIDVETFAGGDFGDGKRYKIRYLVEIRSRGARRGLSAAPAAGRVVRRIQRRNSKLTQHLPPGRYVVRYKVLVTWRQKVVDRTGWSPPSSFTVGRQR